MNRKERFKMAEVYTFEENGELFSFDINNMTVSHDEFHESKNS